MAVQKSKKSRSRRGYAPSAFCFDSNGIVPLMRQPVKRIVAIMSLQTVFTKVSKLLLKM